MQAAAILAFVVMLFARFPPEGAVRCRDGSEADDSLLN